MKRLLAYLFIVLGLGLVFSVNAKALPAAKAMNLLSGEIFSAKAHTEQVAGSRAKWKCHDSLVKSQRKELNQPNYLCQVILKRKKQSSKDNFI